MKVLFAVNNENISTQIVKKFQKDYKEIISYKNMYYFDAIIKELQRDKSYDRIVISEDLEPFSNNNYEAIDKFLFEKLDSISDEATGRNGEDIPIILISTERRMKSDAILVKLFGIGIYNALLGQDRRIDNICALLSKPRGKKEAKTYYQIESEEVNYKSEDEENVSEAEIKNILNHYKRLGKDEDRYVESFNNIAAQYNDSQLRIITKFLPLNVKAVLEEKSPKYQSVMTFGGGPVAAKVADKKEEGLRVGFLKNDGNAKPSNPVIVPRAVNKVATKKIAMGRSTISSQPVGNMNNIQRPQPVQREPVQQPPVQEEPIMQEEPMEEEIIQEQPVFDTVMEEPKIQETVELENEIKDEPEEIEPVRRGRGRPKKVLTQEELLEKENAPKRGRGRPKKVTPGMQNSEIDSDDDEEDVSLPGMEPEEDDNTLPGFDNNEEEATLPGFDNVEEDEEDEAVLPGFGDDEEEETTLPGSNETTTNNASAEEATLPGFDSIEEEEDGILPGFDAVDTNVMNADDGILPGFDNVDDDAGFDNNSQDGYNNQPAYNNQPSNQPVYNNQGGFGGNQGGFNGMNQMQQPNNMYGNNNVSNYSQSYNSNQRFSGVLSKDKKMVCFVGTTKNGTSFLVNNLGKCLSSMGIKTAILDLTSNRNSYYIYTKNEEKLRNIAQESINKLKQGEISGISVDKCLDVFTALPGDDVHFEDAEPIINTLNQNYSIVLLDCDFYTNSVYFDAAQEIYVVQSMDILTIQPMTAFLRDLKAKDILDPNKIRIVINKSMRVRGLTAKAIIGGLAFYNDPAMAFMTELFNKETVRFCEIPFEEEVCARYLEGVMDCEISINGYSKNFTNRLKELANMVYPLVGGGKFKPNSDYSPSNKFSADMNNTLEQMKNRY